MMKFSKANEIMKGQLIRLKADNEIRYLITDSRNKILRNDAAFFAHKGSIHDGHIFLSELYDQGVRNFVVERQEDYSHFRDANFIYVPSSVLALQQLAIFHRSRFNPEVIGITGSKGKTVIKEWLLQLLSPRFRIAATPYSYNSQIGVPLSVWQLDEHHDLGIFETGIVKPGEMEHLEKIIQPTLGILSNIAPAHDEHFTDNIQKINEKLLLFKKCQKFIYCNDHKEIDEAVKAHNLNLKALTWGESTDADVQIISKKKDTGILLQLLYQGETIKIKLPVGDPVSMENLMHCITCMLFLKYSWNEIIEGLNHIVPVGLRMEVKKGINGCYLLDDTYNNDVAGLQIALDFLHTQKQVSKKTVILSDVIQSATKADEIYPEINKLFELHGINRFIGIGPGISVNTSAFNLPSEFFASTTDFLREHDISSFQNEIILIKGSRGFSFEKIVNSLEEKTNSTRLEIDLRAVTHNLNFFRSRLKKETKIMVMVKAFAYGSGMLEIANLLQYHKIDYLGVAYTDEGTYLRQNGIDVPIMVMNPSPEGYEQILQWNLEPEVFSLSQLNFFLNFLHGRNLKIHIKIDTGMSRLGFQEHQLDELISILKNADNLEVVSIFSHLAAADEAVHESFTRQQSKTFRKLADHLCEKLKINPLRHLLNSAGIICFPEYQLDMVRLGIGIYGVEPAGVMQDQLQHISTFKTVISQIKHIPEGTTIGYGRKGKATVKKKIAILALGYADGYSRFFSNGKGEVAVNGQRAPVIGNVCMDMTMIDITDIEAKEGDDVVIFGENPTVNEIAGRIGTISYEIFTSISDRVKRVYVYH